MSRVKKLKEKRRKNKLKIAVVSLALTLAIGSTTVFGTYALFTGITDLISDLDISTGDVSVVINDGFHKTDITPKETFTHDLIITNNGTLNQNIRLSLKSTLDYIDYSVDFVDENITDLENLSTTKQNITNSDKSLFVLPPGKEIKATINVTIKEIPKDVYQTTKNINLVVLSSQINKANTIVDNGFYDEVIQNNTIVFGEEHIISDGNGMKYAGNGNINDYIEIDFNEHYPDVKGKDRIEIVEATGEFDKNLAIVERNNKNGFTIELKKDTDPSQFGKDFDTSNDKIILRFTYSNGTYKDVEFVFRENPNASGNRRVEARYTVTAEGTLPKKQNFTSTIEEEIIEPSESQVLELHQNEELKEVGKPEVLEPPKEDEVTEPIQPEVLEPPKDDETTESSQPMITEPPSDNENIEE